MGARRGVGTTTLVIDNESLEDDMEQYHYICSRVQDRWIAVHGEAKDSLLRNQEVGRGLPPTMTTTFRNANLLRKKTSIDSLEVPICKSTNVYHYLLIQQFTGIL